MSRYTPLSVQSAQGEAKHLLEAVEKSMGRVPNTIGAMANSPALLGAYLGISSALKSGSLSAAEREVVSLAISARNGCNYCLSAHTAIGGMVGVDDAEAIEARAGRSKNPRRQALITLATAILEKRGNISDDVVTQATSAGVTSSEVAEVVGLVAQNVLTNFFNVMNKTEIDFPKAPGIA